MSWILRHGLASSILAAAAALACSASASAAITVDRTALRTEGGRVAVFSVKGIDARRVQRATLLQGSRPVRRSISVRSVRRAAKRGVLRVRLPRSARARERARAASTRPTYRLRLAMKPETAPFGTTCGPGNWPGADRTPFSLGPLRPFARPIPANAPLLTSSAGYTSDQMVAWMNARGPVDKYTINTGGSWDYAHPYYCASSTDPLITLRDTKYIGANNGTRARIPAIAHSRAAAAAGGDGHIAIIQPDGSVIGAWRYAGVSNGVARASGWAKESHVDSGDGIDNFTSTAAWFNNLAGVIRLQELEAGEINHALFLYTNCTWGKAVYPARTGTSARRCARAQAAPPLGAHLQLDPDYVLPAGLPAWKYPILRALQTYGGYVGDTGAYSRSISFGVMLESGQHYVQHGEGDKLGRWAASHADEGHITTGTNGTRYHLLDFARGIDWRRLRIVSPCAADNSC